MPLDPSKYFIQRGWAVLDQCSIDDGVNPVYYIKLCTLRDNDMIAFFLGTVASTLPTSVEVGLDSLPDVLAGDTLIQGFGTDLNTGANYIATYNPIRAQRDDVLCVIVGGKYYGAMRSCPPSNDVNQYNKDSNTLFPKDRVMSLDFCRAGGVPCSPAVDIQAGIPTNWVNAPVGPPTQFNVPVNYGNGKLAKLPMSVQFSPCCANDLNIDMIDPAGGVTFIQTSAGGTPLQQYYVSPVKVYIPYSVPNLNFDFWFDFDAAILAPLVDVDGYYTWTVRITTVDCGIYVVTLKAPIVAPLGGYVELVSVVKL